MKYDEYKNPMDNIGMQDSLLSRFDLLFIVLDQVRQALKKVIVINEYDSKTLLSMHEQFFMAELAKRMIERFYLGEIVFFP